MNNKIVWFVAGALVGTVSSYFVTKARLQKKFENLNDAQFKEQEAYILKKYGIEQEKAVEKKKPVEAEHKEEEHISAEKTVSSFDKYFSTDAFKNREKVNYSNAVEDPTEYFVDESIRVISPRELNDSDYETITLKYYDDDILTDDRDEIIEDPTGIVGDDFKKHFGEYEDDCVYVRNDNLDIDYEILLQGVTYISQNKGK